MDDREEFSEETFLLSEGDESVESERPGTTWPDEPSYVLLYALDADSGLIAEGASFRSGVTVITDDDGNVSTYKTLERAVESLEIAGLSVMCSPITIDLEGAESLTGNGILEGEVVDDEG